MNFVDGNIGFLKGMDLPGVLPPSLAKLSYLKYIDLNRNYLNGTMPREWASMNLEYISVAENRLSGLLPEYLGNITSLTSMSIEDNKFYGILPAAFGKLVNLVQLFLSANNLTGQLPKEFNNLTNLKELRMSRNNFMGKLPDFSSLKHVEKLELEATGFEGPIPASISLLTNLTELRISNLNGVEIGFPLLENMTAMQTLILRGCNMTGEIPNYLTNMPNLKIMDLSFNKLKGNIPDLEELTKLQYMYLTSNLLNGSIPSWVTGRSNVYIGDISYNNFAESSEPPTCTETLNLYRSFSSSNYLYHAEFIKNLNCPKDRYSLYINCGGKPVKIGNKDYEGDQEQGNPGSAAFFCPRKATWGFSSTGHFQGGSIQNHIATNLSILTMNDSQLYTEARLSPLSLTYYGRCLANGNYTVQLHFAEIILRNNLSFYSIGRRLFDIYIQDEIAFKDVDIQHCAKGVDKALVLVWNNTVVKNKTLEIRLVWAGKGTTAVPRRGVYGPLVSAISIEANFKPPQTRKKIVIAVGVVTSVCLVCTIICIVWWRRRLRSDTNREQVLRGLDLQTGFFTFRQIQAATDDFDNANKIGEGGFGTVYKGTLLDGTLIAVKKLSSKSKQGNREFVNEIGMISGLQHPNLVRLYGCCVERNQLLLVYEFMENNSLSHTLFGECRLALDWPTRLRICIGVARGLAFLHEGSPLKIVHRDIKATNVLLDRDLNPKISDFGFAKLYEDENSHISTRVAGTIGYMAPEYALWGYLTHKADVYSFGIVALEVVAGKDNMKYRPNEDYVCLLDWALVLEQRQSLMELVDPRLGSDFNEEEAMRTIKVALLCTNLSPALRPTMSEVVSMLEGQTHIQELIKHSRVYGDEAMFKGLRDKYEDKNFQMSSESQTLVTSSGTAQTGSSSTSYLTKPDI
ncbi:Non-specific serine/threonine protein kinase [Bertholletia excelsa]